MFAKKFLLIYQILIYQMTHEFREILETLKMIKKFTKYAWSEDDTYQP
jgi:hypothetical protein